MPSAWTARPISQRRYFAVVGGLALLQGIRMAQSDNPLSATSPMSRSGGCGELAALRPGQGDGRSGNGVRPRVLKSLRSSRLSEGLPYPLGATWDGLGVNFALFSANATKVELCLFERGRAARDRAHHPAGVYRRGLARLPARCAAGHGLRLSRARSLRAFGRPPLQSQQAADRSLRQADDRPYRVEPGAVRLPGRDRRRPDLRRARQRALRDEGQRGRHGLHLAQRAAAHPRGRTPSSTRRMCAA